MCSINFSNTGLNFRKMVTESANDKLINKTELIDLGKNANTIEEKNFVNALQSKANFQDLKLASFDPGKSTITFNLPEKPDQSFQTDKQPAGTNNVRQAGEQQPETERVNKIVPLLAAIAMILGAFSGAAANETLNSAVNKSLSAASNSIKKPENNSQQFDNVEKDEDPIARQKKMMAGKILT